MATYSENVKEPWFHSEVSLIDDQATFGDALRRKAEGWERYGIEPEDTQLWDHQTPDGRTWLLAHVDLVRDRHIQKTLRLDFDEFGILGGVSPASLNWDSDVSAREIWSEKPPEGIEVYAAGHRIEQLAELACDWFERRIKHWLDSRGK